MTAAMGLKRHASTATCPEMEARRILLSRNLTAAEQRYAQIEK